MIAGERTEAGRQYAVPWNSWDERGWRAGCTIHRKTESLLSLILMRVLDQITLEAPGVSDYN